MFDTETAAQYSDIYFLIPFLLNTFYYLFKYSIFMIK